MGAGGGWVQIFFNSVMGGGGDFSPSIREGGGGGALFFFRILILPNPPPLPQALNNERSLSYVQSITCLPANVQFKLSCNI